MKLRQKLAAVLATAMVLTSMPVVTMAASTNTLSVYNYHIKDSTTGFKITDTVIKPDQTTGAGLQIFTGNEAGQFDSTLIPGIEITPNSTYNLGGAASSPAQTAFIHLTKGSTFQVDALMFYVDAEYAQADAEYNTPHVTKMYFDENGRVQGAKNPTWNGKTQEEILRDQKALTVYMGGSSTKALNDTGMTFQVVNVNNFTEDERTYESTIRVNLFGSFDRRDTYKIPLLAKVGGDKEVLVKVDGNDSFISSNTYTLTGTLTDKRITVASNTNVITTEGVEEIGEIRISETAIDSLQKDGNTNRKIEIELPSSSDLEFNLAKTKKEITAAGRRGFYGMADAVGSDIKVEYGKSSRHGDEDRRTLIIELPSWTDATAKGEITLTGIFVQPEDRTATVGDVKVTVGEYVESGAKSTNLMDRTTLKVAEVKDYDVTLTVKEDKKATVKAGRSGVQNDTEVTFVLEESVKDSLVDGRKIEFVLENGYLFGAADIDLDEKVNYTSRSYKEKALETFKDLVDEGKIEFKEQAKNIDLSSVQLEINQEGQVIGFTAQYPELSEGKADKLEITIPVSANVQSTGTIKLKADNLFTRSISEDIECEIANIVAPIEVAVETAKVKVGLQAQETGSITIKETDKGMLERGWLYLAVDEQDGITFDKLPTIEVKDRDNKTLEIKNASLSKDKKTIGFEITTTSDEASTIEIKDIVLTADRTVPEATYDLAIWGAALTDENVIEIGSFATHSSYLNQTSERYIVDSFVEVTTKNTEDIKDGIAQEVTANFVIGQSEFEVNGKKEPMDSAAYIKDGYTFVPVKYLAKAFGIEGNAVQYDKATSTAIIIAGNKVISITNGKPYIVVNGTQLPMATKAEVKEGRMCVPMSYIAAALGIEKSWDSATKTATFTNVSK